MLAWQTLFHWATWPSLKTEYLNGVPSLSKNVKYNYIVFSFFPPSSPSRVHLLPWSLSECVCVIINTICSIHLMLIVYYFNLNSWRWITNQRAHFWEDPFSCFSTPQLPAVLFLEHLLILPPSMLALSTGCFSGSCLVSYIAKRYNWWSCPVAFTIFPPHLLWYPLSLGCETCIVGQLL